MKSGTCPKNNWPVFTVPCYDEPCQSRPSETAIELFEGLQPLVAFNRLDSAGTIAGEAGAGNHDGLAPKVSVS